jgi:hypothetical protein
MFESGIRPEEKKNAGYQIHPLFPFSAMTKAPRPPFLPWSGRISHQIIERTVNCCLVLPIFNSHPPLTLSTGCPLTGRAGVPDNHNGFLVVLELPLEASPDAASTPHSAVRNAPDFERPFPLHRRAVCPAG